MTLHTDNERAAASSSHTEGIATDDHRDHEEADPPLTEGKIVASPCPYNMDDYEEMPNSEPEPMIQEEESDTTDEGPTF